MSCLFLKNKPFSLSYFFQNFLFAVEGNNNNNNNNNNNKSNVKTCLSLISQYVLVDFFVHMLTLGYNHSSFFQHKFDYFEMVI